MSRLLKAQIEFMKMVPKLINKAHSLGFDVTGGDLFRDSRCPYGSKKSAHHRRLAIDLNLFKSGLYLDKTEDHKPLGEWWETQGGIWGGRFEDGNHYEWPVSALPKFGWANKYA